MNLRDLHYLVLLAEQRNFRRAAAAANVSQPTLSSQIRKMELSLGVDLFERSSRRVTLTRPGIAIVAEARKALDHVNGMREIAATYKDPVAGEFRLGVIASLCPYMMPELLEQVDFDAPRMHMVVQEGLTSDLTQALLAQRLDAVLLATETGEATLEERRLFYEPFLLAMGKRHGLAAKADIAIEDVEKELLLLEEGHCLRDQTLAVCKHKKGDTRLSAAGMGTLLRLVELGRGVTLLPLLAARASPHLVCRPLRAPGPGRLIRLVSRRSFARAGALDMVARCAGQVFAALQQNED